MVFSESFFRLSIYDSDPEWMEWMTTTFLKKWGTGTPRLTIDGGMERGRGRGKVRRMEGKLMRFEIEY